MILALTLTGAVIGAAVGLWLRRRSYAAPDAAPASWWWVGLAVVATAVALGVLAWRIEDPWILLLACVFTGGGVAAIWTDLDAHLLLDALTWPLVSSLALIVVVAGTTTGHWGPPVTALLAAVAVAAVLLVWAVFGSLGLGDVKLGLSTGLVLGFAGGWAMVAQGLILALVAAAVAAIALLATGRSRKSYLPLGPALVVGVFACLAW